MMVSKTPLPATPLPWSMSLTGPFMFVGADGSPVFGHDELAEKYRLDFQYTLHAANTLPARDAEVARLKKALEELRPGLDTRQRVPDLAKSIERRIDAALGGADGS